MKDLIRENIKSDAGYNLGGISSVFLLDVDYFKGFEFEDDDLYDRALVTKIFRTMPFVQLDVVDEAEFSETQTNGIFRQELKTFVRGVRHTCTRLLETAKNKRFAVFFKSMQGQYFCFGSDAGARLLYTLQTGIVTDVNGMAVSIEINSALPLLQVGEFALKNIPYEFFPQFDNAYCVGSEFRPQHTDLSYCVGYQYKPLYDYYTCQTN